jgi:Bacterial membrane protein YfhO
MHWHDAAVFNVTDFAPKRWLLVCGGFAAFFAAVFAPVLFTGKLMASGDAFIESLPAYLGPHHLWEPLMLLGYPMYADPNQLYWYPLAWLRWIPHTFNLFAVLPFWLAAAGTFGLVRTLTRSTIGGAVAGVGFALGGFMISHAGHLMIVHAAAWTPLTLWSLEELRRGERRRWFAILAASIALCALGGQPQVLAFTLGLAVLYTLASTRAAPQRWRYFGYALLAMLLGLLLAAIGLIPQAVLASASLRATLAFDSFVDFSVPLAQLALNLVFPYSPTLMSGFTETTGFAGLGIAMLALVALFSRVADRRVWFWAAIAIGSLALSTGNALGLATLTYQIPLYDLFRIPGRHAFEFTLAASVLAGYGVAAVQRGLPGGTLRALLAIAATAALVAAALVASAAVAPLDVMHDATIVPSLCAFAACALALLLWSLRPQSRVLAALMLAVASAEMVVFAEQAYWRTQAHDAAAIRTPALATALTNALGTTGQRALWAPGTSDPSGISPNLSVLWNVPTVAGYTPLPIANVEHLLGLTGNATVPYDNALDVAGTRFVVAPMGDVSGRPASTPFGARDLGVFIGGEARAAAGSVVLGTLSPVRANRVAMISALGDSVTMPDGARIARVRVTDVAGHTTSYELLAGRDTADAAYDRPDVRGRMKHRRATIASTDGVYHLYATSFPTGTAEPIDHVSIEWTYAGHGALTLTQMALVDDRTATAWPLATFYGERARFRPFATIEGSTIFENLRAYPHAWTVRRLERASPGDAFAAMHRGRAPDGSRFDPRATAFIEDAGPATDLADGAVTSTVDPDGNVRLEATCAAPCFVVSSDAWYPFWRATVDAAPAPMVRTDGALRGLFVPAGHHVVVERYVPLDLLAGVLLSALALAAIVAITVRSKRRLEVTSNS